MPWIQNPNVLRRMVLAWSNRSPRKCLPTTYLSWQNHLNCIIKQNIDKYKPYHLFTLFIRFNRVFYVYIFFYIIYFQCKYFVFFCFLPLSRVLYVVYVSVENYVICTRLFCSVLFCYNNNYKRTIHCLLWKRLL